MIRALVFHSIIVVSLTCTTYQCATFQPSILLNKNKHPLPNIPWAGIAIFIIDKETDNDLIGATGISL
jgi:hypothetical protein